MKIILREEQLKKILNEDMGVSRICVTYSNIIFNRLTPLIDNFLALKKPFKKDIKIKAEELSDAWRGDFEGYIDFPVYEIRVSLSTKVVEPGSLIKNYATGGAAEQIESSTSHQSFISKPPKTLPKYVQNEIDSAMNTKFEFDIYITKDFDESEKNELLFDLRDTILHETNHMLEYFKRYEKTTGFIDVSLGLSGQRNRSVPSDIFKVWEEFLTLVYYSEPHEMRAMVQEMYSVRLRKPFEEFKEHRYYKAAKIMQEFDADRMFDVLVDRIELYNPDSLVITLKNLWKWFLEDYLATVKAVGLDPNRKVMNTNNVLDLMKVLQPRINKAGLTLQKKFNKLYSIEAV